jgi:hypothetical protein
MAVTPGVDRPLGKQDSLLSRARAGSLPGFWRMHDPNPLACNGYFDVEGDTAILHLALTPLRPNPCAPAPLLLRRGVLRRDRRRLHRARDPGNAQAQVGNFADTQLTSARSGRMARSHCISTRAIEPPNPHDWDGSLPAAAQNSRRGLNPTYPLAICDNCLSSGPPGHGFTGCSQ